MPTREIQCSKKLRKKAMSYHLIIIYFSVSLNTTYVKIRISHYCFHENPRGQQEGRWIRSFPEAAWQQWWCSGQRWRLHKAGSPPPKLWGELWRQQQGSYILANMFAKLLANSTCYLTCPHKMRAFRGKFSRSWNLADSGGLNYCFYHFTISP